MMSRLAKTLKLDLNLPSPPGEDLFFGDIKKDSTAPPSIAFVPVVMEAIKEFWAQPEIPQTFLAAQRTFTGFMVLTPTFCSNIQFQTHSL